VLASYEGPGSLCFVKGDGAEDKEAQLTLRMRPLHRRTRQLPWTAS
jgi:hypothetical protein